MGITGIILGLLAIGLFIWLNFKLKDQEMNTALLESELEGARHAYEALMSDFNNYQLKTDRKINELEKTLEIKAKNIDRKIIKFKEDLPKDIRGVIGHIEFSQNNLR